MKYQLERFITAQEDSYSYALKEIKNGKKVTHWIWFIFPQIEQLGFSSAALYYGISCLDEAKEYLKIDYLRNNLIEISQALLDLDTDDSIEVMGSLDSKKLQSCMTLFHEADPDIDVFSQVLDKFYQGIRDQNTLDYIYR